MRGGGCCMARTSMATPSWASWVEAPRWGVVMTLGLGGWVEGAQGRAGGEESGVWPCVAGGAAARGFRGRGCISAPVATQALQRRPRAVCGRRPPSRARARDSPPDERVALHLWRFLLENVQRRGGHGARVQRAREGVVVDHPAARDVDDAGALGAGVGGRGGGAMVWVCGRACEEGPRPCRWRPATACAPRRASPCSPPSPPYRTFFILAKASSLNIFLVPGVMGMWRLKKSACGGEGRGGRQGLRATRRARGAGSSPKKVRQ